MQSACRRFFKVSANLFPADSAIDECPRVFWILAANFAMITVHSPDRDRRFTLPASVILSPMNKSRCSITHPTFLATLRYYPHI